MLACLPVDDAAWKGRHVGGTVPDGEGTEVGKHTSPTCLQGGDSRRQGRTKAPVRTSVYDHNATHQHKTTDISPNG